MEKAKLIIKTTKKGKHIAELLFLDTNKTMPFPQFTPQNASMNGQEVEVQRDQGKISKVQTEGKVIYEMTAAPPPPSRRPPSDDRRPSFSAPRRTDAPRTSRYQTARPGQQISSVRSPAHAPYNFIPLNEKIVAAEKIPGQDFPLNVYHQTRHTGWIDLEIETQTPLYIRDALTTEESKSDRVNLNPDFFSPNGQPQIPGSSLRGMVRTLVEIVSFGKFGFFDDKKLYYRSFADVTTSLQNDYVSKMTQTIQGAYSIKPLAGYFKKTRGNQFVIVPAEAKDNTTYYRVDESLLRNKPFYPQEMAITVKNPKTGKIYQKPNPDYKFMTLAVDFKKQSPTKHGRQYYGEVTEIELTSGDKHRQGWERGTLVCTGWMHGKRRHWVVNLMNKPDHSVKPLQIEDLLMKSYKDDANRDEQADLIKQLDEHPEGVPCFYITDEQGNVSSFGHTGLFRLAYEQTIGEHIPEELKNPGITDITEAIFGNEKTFAGRVFFEDARLHPGQTDVLMGEATPKILSSPKPTTFQHYLTQNSDDIRQLNHYNTNALIRGNKLYWHKSGDNWQETDEAAITQHQTQYTKINPVRPNVKFTGRIRFENLSDVELGALLFSLDLPKGCFHKLGMGKPLGLGSVKIIPKLFLSDRKQRYSDFLAEFDLQESQQISRLKQKFELYICEALREQNVHALWDLKRLKELRTMLDFEKGVELEKQGKIRYMQITPQNEFKDRPVLPMPTTTD